MPDRFRCNRKVIRRKKYIKRTERRSENADEGYIVIENGKAEIDHHNACEICGICNGEWLDKNNKLKKCIIPCG